MVVARRATPKNRPESDGAKIGEKVHKIDKRRKNTRPLVKLKRSIKSHWELGFSEKLVSGKKGLLVRAKKK